VEGSDCTDLQLQNLLGADLCRDVTSPESRDLPDAGGLLTVGLGHHEFQLVASSGKRASVHLGHS
ncbi:hypothetical protein J6590_103098, partial [Homalodisca vitripennis]